MNVENTATIISKEELEGLLGYTLVGGEKLEELEVPSFIYSTSYWTRTSYNTSSLWIVITIGSLGTYGYQNPSGGVRPVITISSDLLS